MQIKRQMAILVIAIFITSLSFSCKDKQDVKPGDIVAIVGDSIISKQEFEKEIGKRLSKDKHSSRSNQSDLINKIKQDVLIQMFDAVI